MFPYEDTDDQKKAFADMITQSIIPTIPTILVMRDVGPNKMNARNNEEKMIEHFSHLFKLLSILV